MLLEGNNPITVDKITTDANGGMADCLTDEMKKRVKAESEVNTACPRYIDEAEITEAVTKLILSLLKCFQGDYQLYYRLPCLQWVNPSYVYIQKFAQGNLRLTTADTEKVSSLLNKRMWREALQNTHFIFNT